VRSSDSRGAGEIWEECWKNLRWDREPVGRNVLELGDAVYTPDTHLLSRPSVGRLIIKTEEESSHGKHH
jgi:hypothetical protein